MISIRFIKKYGRFGAYFYDTLTDNDLDLDHILKILNNHNIITYKLNELKQYILEAPIISGTKLKLINYMDNIKNKIDDIITKYGI